METVSLLFETIFAGPLLYCPGRCLHHPSGTSWVTVRTPTTERTPAWKVNWVVCAGTAFRVWQNIRKKVFSYAKTESELDSIMLRSKWYGKQKLPRITFKMKERKLIADKASAPGTTVKETEKFSRLSVATCSVFLNFELAAGVSSHIHAVQRGKSLENRNVAH